MSNLQSVVTLVVVMTITDICAATNTSASENKSVKMILLWNRYFESENFRFGLGSQPFADHKCKVKECFVTKKRNRIEIQDFDAIVFSGSHYQKLNENDYPSKRSPHQIYVYYSNEASSEWQVYASLDGIFNMTVTHRLDADILFPYFRVVDRRGNVIAPALGPQWMQPKLDTMKYRKIFRKKSLSIAWFVSHCITDSRRENYVKELGNYIAVHTYGVCGRRQCSRTTPDVCNNLIRKKYYFYLAFENALCKDYITEKALMALRNDAVPVIYGGAEIDKFLPPNSYIDASKYTPLELSQFLQNLMVNDNGYLSYFWWRDYYSIVEPVPPLCTLCEKLHDKHIKRKTYKELYTWWHGTKDAPICEPGKTFNITDNDLLQNRVQENLGTT